MQVTMKVVMTKSETMKLEFDHVKEKMQMDNSLA